MIIEFDGKQYAYDPKLIDVQTAVAVHKHTGKGMKSWARAVDDADPVALQALLWVVKGQNGERVPIHTLQFSVLEWHEAIVDAARRELVDNLAADKAPEETDPTVTA